MIKLTVLCEITIAGKDVQQFGQAAAAMVGFKTYLRIFWKWVLGQTKVHQ